MNAPQSLQWTKERRRQQMSEMLRNKGYICRDFLCAGSCPRGPSCPYMHIRNGEVRPIPRHVCAFFKREVCLRDQCTFFHGTQEQLDALHVQQAETYRPQDYMQVAVPPPQYLETDGTIKAPDEQLQQTILPVVPPQPQVQPTYQMAQPTFVMPSQPMPVMFMAANPAGPSTPSFVTSAAPPRQAYVPPGGAPPAFLAPTPAPFPSPATPFQTSAGSPQRFVALHPGQMVQVASSQPPPQGLAQAYGVRYQ